MARVAGTSGTAKGVEGGVERKGDSDMGGYC